MSSCLKDQGIPHVVLERERVGHAWREERWQSLRLLTPNWQNGFRSFPYAGSEPDGFMKAGEMAEQLESYQKHLQAPVIEQCAVTGLTQADRGYVVDTVQGQYRAQAVVLAHGACRLPSVPALDTVLQDHVKTLTAFAYRSPEDLPPGPSLIVGASATGIQLAAEIHGSGRPVTISVGEHVRMPRCYRGRDIQWWLDATGLLNETWLEIDDLQRARSVPSPQIIGNVDGLSLDLNFLTQQGVELVGRCAGFNAPNLQFSGSLKNNCKLADLKMTRLLNNIDEWVAASGREAEFEAPHRFEATQVPEMPALVKPVGDFASVVWATGFKPDLSWVNIDGVLDRKGRLKHEGGVVQDGLYVLGLTFLRRRKSSFIVGAQDDCEDLSRAITDHLSAV